METVSEKYDIDQLKELIEEHVEETGSEIGQEILSNIKGYASSFKKVVPKDYSHMIQAISKLEEKGLTHEQAELEAFYALSAD